MHNIQRRGDLSVSPSNQIHICCTSNLLNSSSRAGTFNRNHVYKYKYNVIRQCTSQSYLIIRLPGDSSPRKYETKLEVIAFNEFVLEVMSLDDPKVLHFLLSYFER
jgi:hypothetical protein